MIRLFIIGLALVASLAGAHAFGMSRLGLGFGKLGEFGLPGVVVPPPACAAAPDGVVDLSVCSNAYYVALIF